MKNKLLRNIIKKIKYEDVRFYAQFVFLLKDILITKKVDWLSWEDPFILEKNGSKYKLEREKNKEENRKRLGYVMPVIDYLLKESIN